MLVIGPDVHSLPLLPAGKSAGYVMKSAEADFHRGLMIYYQAERAEE